MKRVSKGLLPTQERVKTGNLSTYTEDHNFHGKKYVLKLWETFVLQTSRPS